MKGEIVFLAKWKVEFDECLDVGQMTTFQLVQFIESYPASKQLSTNNSAETIKNLNIL